jgi:hypothetical protein
MAKLEPGAVEVNPTTDLTPESVKRFGGYASPISAHVGENGVTMGGLTVWDEYVCAAIPAVIARMQQFEDWAMVGATAGMVADLCLIERKKREAVNAG